MRVVLIDLGSGYIFFDSADLEADGRRGILPDYGVDPYPLQVARAGDRMIGEYGRTYEMVTAQPDRGYAVHRVDVGGSELVPIIEDGQDAETIHFVTEHAPLLGFVAYHDAD